MSNEKLLEKLAKLKAHADSAKEIGNEAEAETFAAKLNEMLLKYKVSLSDVDYAKEMKEEKIVEKYVETTHDEKGKRVYKDAPDVEVRRTRVYWIERLASIVASAHSCDILVITRSSNVVFVGHSSNVAIAEYVFVTLLRAAENLSWKAYGKFYNDQRKPGGDVTLARGYRSSWLFGFVARIAERLREEKRKIQDEFRGDSTTALVRLDREALAVKKYVDELYRSDEDHKNAPSLSGGSVEHLRGYRDGQRVADGMNLRANAMEKGDARDAKRLED